MPTGQNEITNSDDVIDSRSIIERIEYLTDERDNYETTEEHNPVEQWAIDNPDEAAELAALEALQEEAEGYSEDWKHGATLVRDSYFTKYAEELVRDIGDLPRDLPGYVADNINWQGVAADIQVDYTSVDFDGVEYWVR